MSNNDNENPMADNNFSQDLDAENYSDNDGGGGDLDTIGTDKKEANIPYILRSYFTLAGEIVDGKGEGKCNLCTTKPKVLAGNLKVTSNLTRHLQRVHRSAFDEYAKAMEEARKMKSGPAYHKADADAEQEEEDSSSTSSRHTAKRAKRSFGDLFDIKSVRAQKQEAFDKNLIEYITTSLKPFSTVEDEAFRKLFEFDKDIIIMSRRTLMRRITSRIADDKAETLGCKFEDPLDCGQATA